MAWVRRPAILAGAALGAGLVVSLVALRVHEHRHHADLVVDGDHLPARIALVSAGRLRSDLRGTQRVSDAELASAWAARVCGGLDVARALVSASGRDYRAALSLGLDALGAPAKLKDAFACGKAVAAEMSDARVAEIAWLDGPRVRQLVAVRLATDAVPGWAPRDEHTFDKIIGRCTGSPSCALGRPAGFRADGLWYAGSLEDLDAYAAQLGAVAAGAAGGLEELVALAPPGDHVTLQSHPTTLDFVLPCAMAAPESARPAFLRGCYPTKFAQDNERLAVKLSAMSIARDLPALSGRVRVEYVLLGKDEAAATLVATAVRGFWGDMLGLVNDNEVELTKAVVDAAHDPGGGAHRVLFDPWLRAIRGGKVERDGRVVRVVAEADLSAAERAALDAALAPTTRADALRRVVDALAAGQAPAAIDIASFVGPVTGAWLVAPPATQADCTAIARQIGTLASAADLPADQAALEPALAASWSSASCAGRALPEVSKACLLGASSLAAFSACALPMHPDADAALSFLAGRWVGTGAEGAVAWAAPRAVAAAKKTSLELKGSAASFTLDDKPNAGTLEVERADEASCTVKLPVGPRPAVTCVGVDEFGDAYTVPGCTRKPAMSAGSAEYLVEFAGDDTIRLHEPSEKVATILTRVAR